MTSSHLMVFLLDNGFLKAFRVWMETGKDIRKRQW